MSSVDCITSIDIGTDGVAPAFILSKDLSFVGARMGPKDGVFVDVVCICLGSARMIFRKS